MKPDQSLTQALAHFKDWSNYLLVTTVAAAGWVGSDRVTFSSDLLRTASLWCFGISIVFGIFTLALVPLLEQELTPGHESIYKVEIPFDLLKIETSAYLPQACRPQHITFIGGVVLFCLGTVNDWAFGSAAIGVLLLVIVGSLAWFSTPSGVDRSLRRAPTAERSRLGPGTADE